MKRLSVLIASAIVLMLTMFSCTKEKAWRIGVSQNSSEDWRRKMNNELIREDILMGDSLSIDIRSAEHDVHKQIADIQYFVKNGYDLIMVSPQEPEVMTTVLKEVEKLEIPVIVFDRTVIGNPWTAFQGADNLALGRAAGKLAHGYEGQNARIIELRGPDNSTPSVHRRAGFHEISDSLNMQMLASVGANWDEQLAMDVMDSLLRKYPDVNIIYAHNDRMAIGASKVATKLGMRDQVKIIGVDAAPEIGMRAINDGTIDASFIYPTGGTSIVETALAILKHEPYEKVKFLGSPIAIDEGNIELFKLQDKAINQEIARISLLKATTENYASRTNLLIGCIIIIAILVIIIVLLSISYTKKIKRLRDKVTELEHKNMGLRAELAEEEGLSGEEVE